MTRITTGEKVESLEIGLNELREFATRVFQGYYNYAILFEEDDGSYNLVERIGMPCWGALREYECGTRPDDLWPSDLRTSLHIFPKTGKPVAVAASFARKVAPNKPSKDAITRQQQAFMCSVDDYNSFIEFVFNPDISPWRAATDGVELLKDKDGCYKGCVFTNTKIDPNIMLGILRTNVNQSNLAKNWAAFMRNNEGVDPRVAWLKCQTLNAYNFAHRVLFENFFTGKPVDISSGGTFYERESYNRPDIQFLFGGKDNTGELVSSKSVEELSAIAASYS